MTTICELFHSDYIKRHQDLEALKKVFNYDFAVGKYGKGTFGYVKSFFQNVCEGMYYQGWERRGITIQQLQKAVEQKYMQHHYYSNWEARMRNQTDFYRITVKGIRALYKSFNDWDSIQE